MVVSSWTKACVSSPGARLLEVCLIVDQGIAARVLHAVGDPDYGPVREALFDPDHPARLVYGGQLAREYRGSEQTIQALVELTRRNKARLIGDAQLERHESQLTRSGQCRSNDIGILALALASGARLLCSPDRDLQADFTNKRLIDAPRGKVYQSASHKSLLRRPCRPGRSGR